MEESIILQYYISFLSSQPTIYATIDTDQLLAMSIVPLAENITCCILSQRVTINYKINNKYNSTLKLIINKLKFSTPSNQVQVR